MLEAFNTVSTASKKVFRDNQAMTIPNKVHTCWFGGNPKTSHLQACLASQKKHFPGFTFYEWNEENTDLDEFPFLRTAWEEKQYAHLSDMVRLLALYRHGGIYLDTDVEIIRPFEPLLETKFLAGYMWECMLGTAVIGSIPDHPIIEALLKPYLSDTNTIKFNQPNNHMFTKYFIDHVPGFRLTGQEWQSNGIHILNRFGFEQPSLLRKKNFAIHHFSASWKGHSAIKRRTKAAVISIMGLYLYRQYICKKSLRASTFRPEYEKAHHLLAKDPRY